MSSCKFRVDVSTHTKYWNLEATIHYQRRKLMTPANPTTEGYCTIHQVASSHHCIMQQWEAECQFKETAKNRLDETLLGIVEFSHGRKYLAAELYQTPFHNNPSYQIFLLLQEIAFLDIRNTNTMGFVSYLLVYTEFFQEKKSR